MLGDMINRRPSTRSTTTTIYEDNFRLPPVNTGHSRRACKVIGGIWKIGEIQRVVRACVDGWKHSGDAAFDHHLFYVFTRPNRDRLKSRLSRLPFRTPAAAGSRFVRRLHVPRCAKCADPAKFECTASAPRWPELPP